MKKSIMLLLFLAGTCLAGCTQSTKDDRDVNSSDTISVERNTEQGTTPPDTANSNSGDTQRLNNQGIIDGDTVAMPHGTGQNI